MRKIYRQVSTIEKMPTTFGVYFTDDGELKLMRDTSSFFMPFAFFTFDNKPKNPEWWLEEIELPDDEKIVQLLDPLTPQSKGFYIEQRLFGAKWLRDFLTLIK